MADREELARAAIDCGVQVHRDLGPGLLESVYEVILAAMIAERGFTVQRQKPIDINYRGHSFRDAFRIDLLVENNLVIEVKSIERCGPVHAKQLLAYLRLTDRPLGLLMNSGAAVYREGLKRVVDNHSDFGSSNLRVHQPDQLS